MTDSLTTASDLLIRHTIGGPQQRLACTTWRCGNIVDEAIRTNSTRCVLVTGNPGAVITGITKNYRTISQTDC